MDLCHLNNAELAKRLQEYKGRVGIRSTILWYLLKGIKMVTHQLTFFGKENLKKYYLKSDGTKYQHGNVFTCTKNSDYSCGFRGFSQKSSCGKKKRQGSLKKKVKRKEYIRWKKSLLGAIVWKVMSENALRDAANQKRQMYLLFSRTTTTCVDDHLVPPEHYETTG